MALLLNGTDGVTFNDGSDQSTAATPYGRKNLIINGDMRIAQRGTSATGLTAGGYRTVDRFLFDIGGLGTWTNTQSTDVPSGQGFFNSFKVECTTADASPAVSDYCIIQQRFEGQNIQHLKKGTSNAESVTLSFWVKSNKTGTYITQLEDTDNTRNISKSYTIDTANTWEKKTITFAGDTTGAFDNDTNLSFVVEFWLGAGSNYSSGTLATTWESQVSANRAVGQVNLADSTSNYINITGVQLEVGDAASDFEFMPYDMELARCQRYCWVASDLILGTTRNAADLYKEAIYHPVPMRASPSITNSSFNAHTGSNGTVGFGQTRFVGSNGALGVAVWNTASNWTTGAWISISGVISAEL